MTRLRVHVDIDAPPRVVWRAVEDIRTHTRWMEDAVEIRFLTRRRTGVGAAFECDTKVGPLRTVDSMEVVEWRPRRAMGIRHVGIVTGEGRFTLRRRRGGRTRFAWDERLTFPLWVGGPLAGLVARPVLRRVWRRNLRNLKQLVERAR